MREFYPELEPYNSFILDAGETHKIYVEEAGNKDGLPVIFLHGGPGSGCNPNHRRYFDPSKYHIIIFDQRGCNRSTPQGEITENTTQLILEDMESIRERLGISTWLLFGGSWGATLALLYAEAYPSNVRGMILRGCFLARQRDLDWFIKSGVNRLLPDEWEKLIDVLPEQKQEDLITELHAAVHGEDQTKKLKTAKAWSRWATKVVTWNLAPAANNNHEEDDEKLVNEVFIETHYAINHYFIKENQILRDISKLPDVPVHIVHGRKDMTCLMEASWLLHKQIPNSTLEILPDAGHLAGESAMIDALVRATDRFSGVLD